MDSALVPPTGVRLVLAKCTDAARDAEFNAWYDEYATSLARPGFFVDAARYKDASAEGDPERATYVSIYGIAMDDPGVAWPMTYEWWEERGGHPLTPLLEVPYRATYERLAGPGPGTEWPELALRLTDAEPGREHEAEAWYRAVEPPAQGTLTVYKLVDGSPDPPRFLELLGSNVRAEGAYAGVAPDGLLRERASGCFTRVFSYSPSADRPAVRAGKGA
jgi:hypothetical protein